MKKNVTIGIVAAILIVISFLCGRHLTTFNDDEIRSNLAGKWAQPDSSGIYTIRQDGSYIGKWTRPTGEIVTLEGSFRVEDGYMINKVTNASDTKLPAPKVYRNRIIRADVHEIVINDMGDVRLVLRKDTK